jgi:sRNA-binding carbon storage regulator CsrA
MLILSRDKEERVFVETFGPATLVITVVGQSQGEVRLGFEAKRSVEIYRDELPRKVLTPEQRFRIVLGELRNDMKVNELAQRHAELYRLIDAVLQAP